MSNQPANAGAQTRILIQGGTNLEFTLNLSVSRINMEEYNNQFVFQVFFETPNEGIAPAPQAVPEGSSDFPVNDWDFDDPGGISRNRDSGLW